MVMTGCSSCNRDDKTVSNGYDFDSVTIADFNRMSEMYGDSIKFYFYYAQGNLSETVDTMDENVSVVYMETLFQVNDTVVRFIHPEGAYDNPDSVIIEKTNGYWCECMPIYLNTIKVNFTSILDTLRQMEIIKPSSEIVVLRRPLYPPFDEYPYYMFGSVADFYQNTFVILSAKDGSLVQTTGNDTVIEVENIEMLGNYSLDSVLNFFE